MSNLFLPLNLNKLKKADILRLYNHRCKKHGMRYLEHPNCIYADNFDIEAGIHEKIGFLDIETANLHPSFGHVICWCIKEMNGDIAYDVITPTEIEKEAKSSLGDRAQVDKRILASFCKEARKYDKLAVYFGKNRRFDIPYLRHSCIYHGLDFPLYKEVILIDVYDWAKSFLRLRSYRLGIVCKEFGISAKAHDMHPQHWEKANCGNQKAIDYILQHCREDVVSLGAVYKMLEPYARNMNTSI
jgi:uncharacterized protein YprB with RNaseH-like and TPR domain